MDIPTGERDTIIVADVDGVLHFRKFGRDGNMVVDTDQRRLTGETRKIEYLRKQLVDLWPPHELTGAEKRQVITAVTSIIGHKSSVPKPDGAKVLADALRDDCVYDFFTGG